MDSRAQRFARVVRARRDELGLSMEDLARAGGPSTTTMTKLENGRADQIRGDTLKRLDRGLGWTSGSAVRLWRDGAPPTPSEASAREVLRLVPDAELLAEVARRFKGPVTAYAGPAFEDRGPLGREELELTDDERRCVERDHPALRRLAAEHSTSSALPRAAQNNPDPAPRATHAGSRSGRIEAAGRARGVGEPTAENGDRR